MRICPSCGHKDHPMWRPRNSRVFCEFTKAETVEYNDPDLFAKIKEVHPRHYFDGHFLYHITRGGNVERIEKTLHDFMGWGKEGYEKVGHFSWPRPVPLTEFIPTEKEVSESTNIEDTK